MAFWGVEIRSGKPYTFQYNDVKGRLHLSQATLGDGSSQEKTTVLCNVGDKKPIYLCSLFSRTMETCPLNIEFEEYKAVTLSVVGPLSVHLSGHIIAESPDEDFDSDSGEGESFECDSANEKDDLRDDDPMMMFPPSPAPKSGVLEIADEDGFPVSVPAKGNLIGNEAEEERTTGQLKRKKSKGDSGDIHYANRKKDDSTRDGNQVRSQEEVTGNIAEKIRIKKKKQKASAAVTEEGDEAEIKPSQRRTLQNGVVIEDLREGSPGGEEAVSGKNVSVHYIARLKENGPSFDSTIGKKPYKFCLGLGQVIKGFDEGVQGMVVGGKRKLTIPPEMGFGAKGAGKEVPPNAWLYYEVELVDEDPKVDEQKIQ